MAIDLSYTPAQQRTVHGSPRSGCRPMCRATAVAVAGHRRKALSASSLGTRAAPGRWGMVTWPTRIRRPRLQRWSSGSIFEEEYYRAAQACPRSTRTASSCSAPRSMEFGTPSAEGKLICRAWLACEDVWAQAWSSRRRAITSAQHGIGLSQSVRATAIRDGDGEYAPRAAQRSWSSREW